MTWASPIRDEIVSLPEEYKGEAQTAEYDPYCGLRTPESRVPVAGPLVVS